MKYFDMHTHRQPEHPDTSIWNCDFDKCIQVASSTYCSQGLHPWSLETYQLDTAIDNLRHLLESYPQIVAVGECGLDKVCNTPWQLQKEAFQAQIAVADSFDRPLIIHCVKAHNEVMDLKRSKKTNVPWIIHGFRGKPELARQLIDCGFYLSYGMHFNEKSLRSMPLDRLFLETDESEVPVKQLYQQVALQLDLSLQVLTEAVAQNADKVFFNR